MIQSEPSLGTEIEAKFLGGRDEYDQITGWLEKHGFAIERKEPIHRIHIYFDHQEALRSEGCRFRCVIAPGEWCRYDFKADDPTGKGETLEMSIKREDPGSLVDVFREVAQSLPDSRQKSLLLPKAESLRTIMVMSGHHQKALASNSGLHLEISLDTLIPVESGVPLSEVEVELVQGNREDFDSCIHSLERNLQLKRGSASKLDRALWNS